jgi:hypothetical protein
VDVLLDAGGCGAVMGLIEPAQELDGLGDLLLRRANRPVGDWPPKLLRPHETRGPICPGPLWLYQAVAPPSTG